MINYECILGKNDYRHFIMNRSTWNITKNE